MADYGLLAGLAEGIKSGVQSYQDTKKYNDEQERRKKDEARQAQQFQLGLLDKNAEVDPATGELKRNSLAQAEYDRQTQALTPGSEFSKKKAQATRDLVSSVDPKYAKFITDDMSAKDIEENTKEGLLGKIIQGEFGARGREATSSRVGERNQILREGLDLRRENQASHVADLFDKDKIIQDSTQQKNRIQNGRHTLESAKTLTPQMLDEIQADINAAISKGGSNAASLEHKRTFNSLGIEATRLKQRLTDKPEDINNPEIKQYLTDIMNRLEGAYDLNMSERAKSLSAGRGFSSKRAQDALEGKKGLYIKDDKAQGLLSQPQSAAHPEDSKAVAWAKQNMKSSDPKTRGMAQQILSTNGEKF